MTVSHLTACRSCGAAIRWARTRAGNLMPLDAHPDPNGNVEIVDGIVHVHPQPPLTGETLWMPHHATCPDADTWRRA